MAMAQCMSGLRGAPLRLPTPEAASSSSISRKKYASSYKPIVMEFYLKPLPFKMDALEPYMSRRTLEFHWGKHHRSYVDNLNKQIADTELQGKDLEEILKLGYNNGSPTAYFNNAGQVWNHDFFWQSIKPPGRSQKPKGELLRLIKRDLGSFEDFISEFKQAAATQFGSGWVWLAAKKTDPFVESKAAKLVIEKTPNAINPLILGHIPLLTIDVWEHAYFLDFHNRRPDYISTFVDKLISWEAVASRLGAAQAVLDFRDVSLTDEDYQNLE